MRALFLPYYDESNPYQQELARALSRAGVTVLRPSRGGPFRIFRAATSRNPPDVVHFHWLYGFTHGDNIVVSALKTALFLAQVLLLRLLGIRVVWTVHNKVSHSRDHPEFDIAVRRVFALLCDSIITHCESAQAEIERAYELDATRRANCHVIPHGHYIGNYANEIGRAEARHRLDIAADEHVFLYFGRVCEYKNVPGLIEAFRELDDEKVRLIVAGRPKELGYETQVRAGAAADSRVTTDLRFIPDEEVQVYMNAADVVVLPFETILTSGSAMLAASFGKPVVAPAIGCVGEFLAGDIVYDPADPFGLRDALERTLTADLDAIGAKNYARARACDWNEIAQSTAAAYRGDATAPLADDRPVAASKVSVRTRSGD